MQDFLLRKYLKLNWLKCSSEVKGALRMVIDSKGKNEVVVKSQTKKMGHIFTSMSPECLLSKIEKENGLYEIIDSYPHKLYFDMDQKAEPSDDYYPLIINAINEIFPDGDMAISGSVTAQKTSYHITLNNYLIKNEAERDALKEIILHLKDTVHESFDTRVYNSNQSMKAVNQAKEDGRIQTIVLNTDLKKHLITCFFNENTYSFDSYIKKAKPEIKEKLDVARSRKPLELGNLPVLNLVVPENINIQEATPIQLLSLIPLNDKDYDHTYTHLVARFCYANDLTLEQFLAWYAQKNNTHDLQRKWIYHWNNLPKFPPVSRSRIICILQKFYPQINIKPQVRSFNNMFDINCTNVDKLTQDVFNTENKFTVLNFGMGKGKTYQTIKYLKDKPSFCWMTPIIALAQNTHYRLTEDGISCKYYNDSSSKKSKANLSEHDKIIICINSLQYIAEKKYDIVVIDEIETLLNKWFNNNTLEKVMYQCWTVFIDIIKNAKKVIFLDAFTSKLTLNFIEKIHYGQYDLFTSVQESTRTINVIDKKEKWFSSIATELKANKKLFIFYPYKSGNAMNESMDLIKRTLEEATGKKGVAYNADSDDEILKGLENVNNSWSQYDFVLTNSKITVGVNFELDYFDSVYLAIGSFSSTRDAVQVSYRCRSIKSNVINVCFLSKFNSTDTLKASLSDCRYCPIYQQLYKDALIEKHAPLQSSFFLMCKLANYKIQNVSMNIDNGLNDIFNKFQLEEVCYDYSMINDVFDIDELEQKIFSQKATLDDKMMMKKYYFNRKFIMGTCKNKLAEAWDNKFNKTFFDQLTKVIEQPDHIFNKIQLLNNADTIFLEDHCLKKVNLSPELITEIFEYPHFHFKSLTTKSKPNVIYKHIINSYFEMAIIKSAVDENRNTDLNINQLSRDMLDFGMARLNRKVVGKTTHANNSLAVLLDRNVFNDEDDEIINNNVVHLPLPIINKKTTKINNDNGNNEECKLVKNNKDYFLVDFSGDY